MLSIHRCSVILLSSLCFCSGAETPLWEPGKVVAIEQVSTPAREPDPSCRSVPKGATIPAPCRSSNLRAQQFWRVTVDVGNRRFVVRPYRAPKFLESLTPEGPVYIDLQLTEASSVELAVVSSKTVRLRTDKGQGVPAIVDSQEMLSKPEAAASVPSPPPPRPNPAALAPTAFRVVLLEDKDFRDLEVQESKSQDIGDGALLYSFTGDSSPARSGSNAPVFLVLADTAAAMEGNLELSRLQVGNETRQMVYSQARNRSASSIPILVTQASATVRKVSVREPLSPGEYVLFQPNSARGFLFGVR